MENVSKFCPVIYWFLSTSTVKSADMAQLWRQCILWLAPDKWNESSEGWEGTRHNENRGSALSHLWHPLSPTVLTWQQLGDIPETSIPYHPTGPPRPVYLLRPSLKPQTPKPGTFPTEKHWEHIMHGLQGLVVKASLWCLLCWGRHWYYPLYRQRNWDALVHSELNCQTGKGIEGFCLLVHVLTDLWILVFSFKCILSHSGQHGRAAGTFVLASSRATGFSSAAYLLFRLSTLFKEQTSFCTF